MSDGDGPADGGEEHRGRWPAAATGPEREALLADSVGRAVLVALETLTPAERLAFVLHDVFALPFDEIGPIVNRSPDAAEMLASRARRRVQSARLPDPDRSHSSSDEKI
jgi:DNA-directed RNA polymerase specialized sigma24 family protein